MCPAAFETALLVIGGIIDTAGLVMQGKRDIPFVQWKSRASSEGDDAIEFCHFKNVTIAAMVLQNKWNIHR
jgi:acetoin utilization deacetylase AcuC-like enzyme